MWKLYEVPVGPEDSREKKLIKSDTQEAVLAEYEERRQSTVDGGMAVLDESDQIIYVC